MGDIIAAWDNAAFLGKAVTICTWITVVAPFLFGAATLLLQHRVSDLQAAKQAAAQSKIQELERKTEQRHLPAKDAERIRENLKAVPLGNVTVATSMMDGESAEYGEDFVQVFRDAGWRVLFTRSFLDSKAPGFHVGRLDNTEDSRVNQIVQVFMNAGFSMFTMKLREGVGVTPEGSSDDEIIFAIGRRA